MMKNTSQEIFDTDSLLQDLVKYFDFLYISDLRQITLSQIYQQFYTNEKVQKYDLPTWSKALSYILGKDFVFQDYQSLMSFLSGSTSP